MKKQISVAILSFMLIMQIMANGVMMPLQALAAPTNTASIDSTLTPDQVVPAEEKSQDMSTTETTVPVEEKSSETVQTIEQQVQQKPVQQEPIVKPSTTDDQVTIEPELTEQQAVEQQPVSSKITKKLLTKKESLQKAEKPTSIIEKVTVKVGTAALEQNQLNNVKLEDAMSLDYALAIPLNTYKAGDTFTIDLPQQFNTKNIDNATGNIGALGTYEIVGNKVVITFNKNVENENGTLGVDGKYYLYAGVKLESTLTSNETNSSSQEITINTITGQEKYPLQIKPQNTDNTIKKKGVAGKLGADGLFTPTIKNTDTISWEVTFNKSQDILKNAVFTDTFDATQLELIDGSFKVTELNIALDGTVTEGAEVTADFTKTTTNTWKIAENSTKAYKITYLTKILDKTERTYVNNASLKAVNMDKSVTSAITVERESFIKKIGKATETGADWTIQYNYSESALSNAVIVDKITDNHAFDPASLKIYPVAMNDKGQLVASNIALDPSKYTIGYTAGPIGYNTMNITIKGESTSAYTIHYSSTLVDPTIAVTQQIKNTATSKGKTTGEVGVTNQQRALLKGYQDVDFQKQEITWNIWVNEKNYDMKNMIIEDTFKNANLNYIEGSAKIDGVAMTASNVTVKKDGLTFTLGDITKKVHIMYKTKLDPTVNKDFVNQASATWTTNDKPYTTNVESTVKLPNYVKNNGFKDGSVKWNAEKNKYIMSWEVGFNYKLQEVKAGTTITDVFDPANMTLLTDSLKMVEVTIEKGDKGTVTEAIVPISKYRLVETEKGFTITLKEDLDSTKAYKIIYDTSDSDAIYDKSYKNTITVTYPNGLTNDFSKTIDLPNGGQGLTKSGKQVGKSRTFNYQLDINKSKSTLPNAVVHDKLSTTDGDAQAVYFIAESFDLTVEGKKVVLLPTTADNKTASLTEYYLYISADKKEFKVIFPTSLTSEATLKYNAYFEGDKGALLNNEAQLNFSGSTETLTNKGTKELTYTNNSSASAWGTVVYKELFIQKVDSVTGKPLAGATFEIYKEDDLSKVYRIGTTDRNGLVKFENIRLKDSGTTPYIVKETQAPTGYLIDPEYAQGKLVEFSIENQKMTTPFKITNAAITPEPKPDPKPDPEPEVKPEPKPDPEPEVKPEPKPETDVDGEKEEFVPPTPETNVGGEKEEFVPPTTEFPGNKPNTEYEVVEKETNKVVATGKSDNTGKLVVKKLPKGNYYLVEKGTKIYKSVTVGKNGQVLPQTGEENTALYSLLGGLVLAIAVFMIVRSRRQKQA
ncbi:LPXTG cell wall anchor domain-containing protein [Kurthia sibirica]|uniref:Gram-positive cocci surface proteins LPxTG domain-containing protein n=1 Tax=Kurthia sibirica TaxID=202750 RepID=A0A2U3AF25_9BACL|nr:LPXTG cell wall anchor domain-containing protein [Kurthia sibirica]PWI23115.1 hypothetical protein DEX24_16450 [Kurthia sibirica]GEK35632.1 hypothetical protein KSI01_31650 [Kurthia sibirica]